MIITICSTKQATLLLALASMAIARPGAPITYSSLPIQAAPAYAQYAAPAYAQYAAPAFTYAAPAYKTLAAPAVVKGNYEFVKSSFTNI